MTIFAQNSKDEGLYWISASERVSLDTLKLCSAVSEYRRQLVDPLEGPCWYFMDVEGVSGKELLTEEDRGSEDSGGLHLVRG